YQLLPVDLLLLLLLAGLGFRHYPVPPVNLVLLEGLRDQLLLAVLLLLFLLECLVLLAGLRDLGFRHYPVPPVNLVHLEGLRDLLPLVDLLLLLLLAVLLLLFLPECLEYLVRLADLLLQLDRSDRWGPGHLDHLWLRYHP